MRATRRRLLRLWTSGTIRALRSCCLMGPRRPPSAPARGGPRVAPFSFSLAGASGRLWWAAGRAGWGAPLDRRFVFRLGCCCGRLGMRRAGVLVPEGIPQLPEEHGVMSLPMDAADGWQLQLARQLKRSGIEVDLNRLV